LRKKRKIFFEHLRSSSRSRIAKPKRDSDIQRVQKLKQITKKRGTAVLDHAALSPLFFCKLEFKG